MNTKSNISEIRAEVLLNHLYPELTENWIVRNKGSFYRNYSDDILKLDEKSSQLSLSRDGFLRLLPQGLICTEEELKGGEFSVKYEALTARKKLLEELFIPFDSWSFRESIHNEEELAELLENKLSILLKTYYGVDIEAETNPYVREFMKLLPKVSRLRGNFHRISDVLTVLLNHRVTTEISCYDWSDKPSDTQPLISYKVWIPNLTREEYIKLENNIEGLLKFIVEWFIPFNIRCVIELKTENSTSLDNGLLLNYNTKLSL